jgi:hypothetical protein
MAYPKIRSWTWWPAEELSRSYWWTIAVPVQADVVDVVSTHVMLWLTGPSRKVKK